MCAVSDTELSADWSIYRYSETVYKICKFPNGRPHGVRRKDTDSKPDSDPDSKLAASLSRSRRVVLELALCNDWDYFCTFTLSPDLDRFDLDGWYKSFAQWLRDRRKDGYPLNYLLIPEKHEKGSWHCHGLMSGLPPLVSFSDLRYKYGRKVPDKLVDSHYLCWTDYDSKFGFCSLAPVENPEAVAFYVTKYMTKDNSRLVSAAGKHLYYCSRGLNRASDPVQFYDARPDLERFLSSDGAYCKSGFVRSISDGSSDFYRDFGWTATLAGSDLIPFEPLPAASYDCAPVDDPVFDFEQLSME